MTITPILWYRPNKKKEYFIKIRIAEREKARYINLKISIPKRFWNNGKVSKSHPDSDRLNEVIKEAVYSLENRLLRNKDSFQTSSFPQSEVNGKGIAAAKNVGDVLRFFIEEFQSNGRIGSAKKHVVVYNHAKAAGIDIIGLNEYDTSHVNQFRHYLTDVAQVQPHGRHTYEKIIKKVFTRASTYGLRQGNHPYNGMRFKVPKSAPPRHLGKFELHAMEERLIYGKQAINPRTIALSMFLFSTYSYGMRFSDVATLRWSNINEMKLSYKMKKTDHPIILSLTPKHANLIKYFLPEAIYPRIYDNGQSIYDDLVKRGVTKRHPIVELEKSYYDWKIEFIMRIKSMPEDKWKYSYVKENNPLSESERKEFMNVVHSRDSELMKIIKRQTVSSVDYIFPLLEDKSKSLTKHYNEISSKNVIVNKALKGFAAQQNWSAFSFHAARHTFANNIREVEPDILKISRMLGHKNLSLTQEYLKRFERLEDYTSNQLFIGLHDDFLLMKSS